MDCCALSIILWNICIVMCELLLVERKRDQLNTGKKKKKNISIVKYCRPRLGRLSSTSTVVIHSKLVYKLTLSWLIDLLYFDWCLVHSNHWALLFTQTFSTFHVRTVHTRRKRSRIKKRNNIWSIVFFVVIITSSRWSRTKPLRKCFWWEYNQRRIYVFVYVYA